jgi:hypothetical protein
MTRITIYEDRDTLNCGIEQIFRFDLMPDPPQITLHTVFPPEVDRSTLQLTSKVVWPVEVSLIPIPPRTVNAHIAAKPPIPKPRGVVGRIKEGGYSLIKVLGWEREQYNEIQVRLVQTPPNGC